MNRNVPRSRASAPMKKNDGKKGKIHTVKGKRGFPEATRSLNDDFCVSSDTASNLAFDEQEDGTLNNIVSIHCPGASQWPYSMNGIPADVSLLAVVPARGRWSVRDVVQAAQMLMSFSTAPKFSDDASMRRTMELLFEAFKYRYVLDEMLTKTSFFMKNPLLYDKLNLVRLLLFDFMHRRFTKREPAEEKAGRRLFPKNRLHVIEEALWEERVHLGAAVSRLRIIKGALEMEQLLPPRLQKASCMRRDGGAISCWVNNCKCRKKTDLCSSLLKIGITEAADDGTELMDQQFRFDHFCHRLLTCKLGSRAVLADSWLVRNNHLILQGRSCCLGPSAFCCMLQRLGLRGDVLQTHTRCARTTAYLATLLRSNPRIGVLRALGAGDRRDEFANYLCELGIRNATVHSESLMEQAEQGGLEGVIAVFATPPSTMDLLRDPLELLCCGYGDLGLMDLLTRQQNDLDDHNLKTFMLEEQKMTLRVAMSLPQVQFVVYETHAAGNLENEAVVEAAVQAVNVLEEFFDEDNPREQVPGMQGDNNNSDDSFSSCDTVIGEECIPDYFFEKAELPDMCPQQHSCLRAQEEGCYFALLQRRKITQPDIPLAARDSGSEGSIASAPAASGRLQQDRKPPPLTPDKKKLRPLRKSQLLHIERLSTPTPTMLLNRARVLQKRMALACTGRPGECPKHVQRFTLPDGRVITLHDCGYGSCKNSGEAKLSEEEKEALIERLTTPTAATMLRMVRGVQHQVLSPQELILVRLARRLQAVQHTQQTGGPLRNTSSPSAHTRCPPPTPAEAKA